LFPNHDDKLLPRIRLEPHEVKLPLDHEPRKNWHWLLSTELGQNEWTDGLYLILPSKSQLLEQLKH
jgi:hypothetical protein